MEAVTVKDRTGSNPSTAGASRTLSILWLKLNWAELARPSNRVAWLIQCFLNTQRHFTKRDDCCSEMIECQKAAFEFFVAHQQFTQTVEPAMAHLHDSTPPAWPSCSGCAV